jgi:hypothetical protein
MRVRIAKMRENGVEHDRRVLRDGMGHRGLLVIIDVSDQGLRRPAKVARLMQGHAVRHELTDVHIVWRNDGRPPLPGLSGTGTATASRLTTSRVGYAPRTSILFLTSYCESNGI